MKVIPIPRLGRPIEGFTLIELTVVLVLIGTIMTLGLKMVVSTLENAAYSETKAKQETIKVALIAYLRTNGVLPCPDRQAVPTGQILPATCIANASEGYGVLPWQALGLSKDVAIDGFGNFFSYRIANGNGTASTKNWTSRSAATDFTINELRVPSQGLTVTHQDGSIVQDAVVILVSHGKNGYGAKTIRGTLNAASASPEELSNAASSSLAANIRPISESFDDLVAYMRPSDLLQPLINEGTLKSCVAYCVVATSCTCSSGTAYCTGSGPACTSGGTLACPTGPGCSIPTLPCTTSFPIPVGKYPAACS